MDNRKQKNEKEKKKKQSHDRSFKGVTFLKQQRSSPIETVSIE